MPKTQTKRGLSPRELDALRKQFVAEQKQIDSASKWQLANDIASGINDIVGRGVIAPILGMPGDINQAIYDAGAWVNNKIKDVEVATGMVKQPRYVQPSQGNAYLGSEDIGNRMQQAGLVSSERRPMTELAASFVSPSAVAKTAINAPKTAMNMLRMAENLEAPSRGVRNAQGMYIPRGQMGAIDNLYHGSPHTFDRFDLSKIGTGEGEQAYGYGAYLSESPDVAKTYAPRDITFENKVMQLYKQAEKSGDYDSMSVYENYLIQKQPEEILAQINDVESGISDSQKKKMLSAYKKAEALYQNQKGTGLYQARLAWPDSAREAADPLSPENFLDWDKPLSQQGGIGRFASLPEYARPLDDVEASNIDGQRLYQRLVNKVGEQEAARILNQAGIPGVRYLDAGSRGAGKGTSNYVVFDDKMIDIVSRNNQPIRKAEAPQAKALREAQINAAKPVSEGGLGLRPDNTPEERAAAMGFDLDEPIYHGTKRDFTEFEPGDGAFGRGIYATGMPNRTKQYWGGFGDWTGGQVMPVVTNANNSGPLVHAVDLVPNELESPNKYIAAQQRLIGQGYDSGASYVGDALQEKVIFDPRNIRSRFAAFDPMRRDSSDLLAGLALPVVAAPVVSESNKKKRKDKKK